MIQNKPGTIRRLNFEQFRGDDYRRVDRVRKGLQRDVTTPKYSVLKSVEGTRLFELIDRNDISAAVESRNEIAASLSNFTPVIIVDKILLSYIENYLAVKQLVQTTYQGDAEPIPPGVYR